MNQVLEPISRAQYNELFLREAPPDPISASVAATALKTALDVRKFEIELYWKRTTYFWAFIAAALVAYCETARIADAGRSGHLLQELFACAGLVFSYAWLKMNQGSKFWQTNWEAHVDFLEDEIQGPLYKVIAESRKESARFLGARAYSVSRVNQFISLFVVCIWIVLLVASMTQVSPHLQEFAHHVLDGRKLSYDALSLSGPAVAAVSCRLIHKCGKSDFAEHLIKGKENEGGIQFYRRG